MTHFLNMATLALVSLTLATAPCMAADPPVGGPASVERSVVESDLNHITLTPAAITRLGIETAPVDSRTIDRVRTLGGQIISPPGQDLMVSAPVSGVIVSFGQGSIPTPGSKLARGAPVVGLLPYDSSGLAGSPEYLAAREAEFTAVENRVDRLQQLVDRGGASQEELESARSQMAQARATLALARAQNGLSGSDQAASDAAIPVTAPVGGTLGSISVARGQTVSAGQQLFQVQGTDDLWVRVPVFAGAINELQGARAATVRTFDGRLIAAQAAVGPPSADPVSASVDLYFKLEDDASVSPGERVVIDIQVPSDGDHTVIPQSAVFRDIYGGTWVYVRLSDTVFARQRVRIAYTVGSQSIIIAGPPVGTDVVSVGVAELAGTEFGVAH